jgi:hypothetical protein
MVRCCQVAVWPALEKGRVPLASAVQALLLCEIMSG